MQDNILLSHNWIRWLQDLNHSSVSTTVQAQVFTCLTLLKLQRTGSLEYLCLSGLKYMHLSVSFNPFLENCVPNCRMAAGVLEDKPLVRRGHPELVVQDYIQMAFKYLKRWELHYLSGQPFPACLERYQKASTRHYLYFYRKAHPEQYKKHCELHIYIL